MRLYNVDTFSFEEQLFYQILGSAKAYKSPEIHLLHFIYVHHLITWTVCMQKIDARRVGSLLCGFWRANRRTLLWSGGRTRPQEPSAWSSRRWSRRCGAASSPGNPTCPTITSLGTWGALGCHCCYSLRVWEQLEYLIVVQISCFFPGIITSQARFCPCARSSWYTDVAPKLLLISKAFRRLRFYFSRILLSPPCYHRPDSRPVVETHDSK